MNKVMNNMDDLFDDSLDISLRQIGIIFPKTPSDFRRIEMQCKQNKNIQPDRLNDPYSFLGEKKFQCVNLPTAGHDQNVYLQNLAQAAREGKTISDDIKNRMEEDKIKAKQKKNEN